MKIMRRRGQTLFILFAATLLVAAQIYLLTITTSNSFRRADKVKAQLEAHFVAQSGYGRITARLLSLPWDQRWFKTSPALEEEVAIGSGKYSSLVETVADPDRQLADIWIRGMVDSTKVLMFWRVEYVKEGFDLEPRLQLSFFTYLPSTNDLPSASENALRNEVQSMMEKRRQNEGPALTMLASLSGMGRLDQITNALNIPSSGPILDELTPVGGGGGTTPQDTIIQQARPPPQPPPVPPPTPEPTPTPQVAAPATSELLARNPMPSNFKNAVFEVLRSKNIDPENASNGYYQRPEDAQRWLDQMNSSSFDTGFDSHASAIIGITDELADSVDLQMLDATQAQAATEALSMIQDYVRAAAESRAAASGLPPPDPTTFSEYRQGGGGWFYDGTTALEAANNTQMQGYLNWLSRNGLGSGGVRSPP